MHTTHIGQIRWVGILDGVAFLALYLLWRWHVISQRVLLGSLLIIGMASTVLILRSLGLIWREIAILYALLAVNSLGIWIGSRIGRKG